MCFRTIYRLAIATSAVGLASPSHADIGVNGRGQLALHRRLVRSEDAQRPQAIELQLQDPGADALENTAFENLLIAREADRDLASKASHDVEYDDEPRTQRTHPEDSKEEQSAQRQIDQAGMGIDYELRKVPGSQNEIDRRGELEAESAQFFMASGTNSNSLHNKRAVIVPRGYEPTPSRFDHQQSTRGSEGNPIELALSAGSEKAPSSSSNHKIGLPDRSAASSGAPQADIDTSPHDELPSHASSRTDSEPYRALSSSRVLQRPHPAVSSDGQARESHTQFASVQRHGDEATDMLSVAQQPVPTVREFTKEQEPLTRKLIGENQDAANVAASAAAQRVVSQSSSTERAVSIEAAANAAATAAVTAARVAASLPANLPEDVRKAALKAAATAAAKATLESSGSSGEAALGTQSRSPEMSAAGVKQGIDPPLHQLHSDDNALPSKSTEQNTKQVRESSVSLPRRDVHQVASSDMIGHGQSVETADNAEAPDEDRLLYIGVFSQSEDFEKRADVRKAWVSKLREQYGDSKKVLVEFVIGRQPRQAEADEVKNDVMLERERHEHSDLFHVPYEELPVKALMFFAHAVEMRYRFALKIDIDRELLYQPLIDSLQKERLGKLLYAGQNLHDASLLEAADRNIQKYFSGPCYLASWSLAQRISKAHLDHSIMLWSYNTEGIDVDDMDMGQWVSWEDKMLLQTAEEKRKKLETVGEEETVVAERVDYRIMDICRPLPPPDIRFSD